MKKTAIVAIFLGVVMIIAAPMIRAEHPTRDYRGLVPIAHELELAARHVHQNAEQQAHHGSRSEAYALDRLHNFNEAAAHFHNEVERYSRNPRHTESDFRVLVNAYFDAQAAMRGLHAFEHVYEDFSRVAYLIRRLINVYSGYGHYFPRNYYDHGDNDPDTFPYEDKYGYEREDRDHEHDEHDHEHEEDIDDYDEDYED